MDIQKHEFVENINNLRNYVVSCGNLSAKEFFYLAVKATTSYDDKDSHKTADSAPVAAKKSTLELTDYLNRLNRMPDKKAKEMAEDSFIKRTNAAYERLGDFDKLSAVLLPLNRGIRRMHIKTPADRELRSNLVSVFNALNAGVNVQYPGQREYLVEEINRIRPISGSQWKEKEIKTTKILLQANK